MALGQPKCSCMLNSHTSSSARSPSACHEAEGCNARSPIGLKWEASKITSSYHTQIFGLVIFDGGKSQLTKLAWKISKSNQLNITQLTWGYDRYVLFNKYLNLTTEIPQKGTIANPYHNLHHPKTDLIILHIFRMSTY